MPIRSLLRGLVLLAAGAIAVVVALEMATSHGSPITTITPWGGAASPPATAHLSIPTPGSTASPGPGGLPNLGQHINDETGSVARGQMGILDELEKAIADQIRGIIRHAEGH
jgi:hypothetical protein